MWLAIVRLVVQQAPAGTAGAAESSEFDVPIVVVVGLVVLAFLLGRKFHRGSAAPTATVDDEPIFIPPHYMVHMSDDAIAWIWSVRSEVDALRQLSADSAGELEKAGEALVSLQDEVDGQTAMSLRRVAQGLSRTGTVVARISSQLENVVGQLGREQRPAKRRAR